MFAPRGFGQRWILLIGGDLVAVVAAVYAAIALTGHPGLALATSYGREQVTAMIAGVQLPALYFQDLYQIDRPRSDAWVVAATIMSTVILAIVLGVLVMVVPEFAVGRIFLGAYLACSIVILVAWRFAANSLFFNRFNIGVMALGAGEWTPVLAAEVQRWSHLGYRFLGIAAPDGRWDGPGVRFPSGLSGRPADSLANLSPRNGVNVLVVAESVTEPDRVRELVQCRVRGTHVFDFESFYERLTGKLPLPLLRDSWLLFAPGFGGAHWRRMLKRITDVTVSLAIAAITLPITLMTAVAVKLDSSGPVFYSQRRVGLDGVVFKIYKFRSMRLDAEQATGAVWAVKKDPRVTRVGRVIRRARIDELPQLLNVLRGDMSFVGPRPERPEIAAQLEKVIPYYQYRHFARPGLTGWAQVCYPYGATPEEAREKLCFDLYYIKNWSLLFDTQIILQTIKVVLFGRGAR